MHYVIICNDRVLYLGL